MSWWWSVFVLEIKKILAYRAVFWVDFFLSTFAHVLIAYVMWKSIYEFEGVTQIRGYSLPAMTFYYLSASLVEKVNQGAGWRAGASVDIYEGSLSKYLLFPLGFVNFKVATHFAHVLMNWAKALLGFVFFSLIFGVESQLSISVVDFLYAFSLTLLGAYLWLMISLFIDCVAFWADNVWSLQVMFKFLSQMLGGAMVPLALFPEAWKPVIKVMPFLSLFHYPISALMGSMNGPVFLEALAVGVFWIVAFRLFLEVLWRRGLKNYSGVGV
jgi:ABC-2 type transport system permease protein